MHISKAVFAFILYVANIHASLAAPVHPAEDVTFNELEIRAGSAAGSDKSNPIKATMDVNDNNALPFDGDCYAILCLEKKPLL